MKKITQLLLILSLLLTGASFGPEMAAGVSLTGDGAPDAPLDPPNKIFLPAVLRPPSTYLVSGQVTGPNAQPLAGAVVSDATGRIAITDQNGVYQLSLPPGANALAPTKDGFLFTPSMMDVNIAGNLLGQDFSASSACTQGVVNGGFEDNVWWTSPASDTPAVYSTDVAHSGVRSARTGILNIANNIYSYSSLRTPLIGVPGDATSVILRLWLYPKSGEAATTLQPSAPSLGDFGDAATAYDAQYVVILDDSGNLLETLLWMRSNNQMWTYHEFNLTKWAGQSIKIQIGTYNDGSDGVTSLYVDDVSLESCSGVLPPPPTPATCNNLLGNSGFEYNASWGIPTTQYPAGYSYDAAFAGVRSMRTGIPLYLAANRYSYSDAWQTVSIPAAATSAVLRIKIWPQSQELLAAGDDQDLPEQEMGFPEVGALWGEAALAYDSQYILVLNPTTGTILEYLWNKTNRNSADWLSKEFDLMKYAGKSIRIQFGTYNDGYGGRSVMYVDEAYVDVCTGVTPPPPPPPPPPTCTERVTNTSFENNLAWYIPITEFSAGYSTARALSGVRSMRSGIVYSYHNRYSYSDFRQTVSIPAGSSSATLGMWSFNTSSEPSSILLAARPTAAEFGEAAMAGDVQYLLVLDVWGNWIDTLLWQRVNEGYWHYRAFELKKYAGSTINLQWGVYNDGWGGVTSMYVDDVSLVACP